MGDGVFGIMDHCHIDRYGHSAGDRVLRQLAQVMRDNIRASDIPVRLGGDEFIVHLPETDIGRAIPGAEKFAAKASLSTSISASANESLPSRHFSSRQTRPFTKPRTPATNVFVRGHVEAISSMNASTIAGSKCLPRSSWM